MMGEILKQIPGKILAICGTCLVITVLGCVTFLSAQGQDATNVTQVVNTILNFLTLGVAGTAAAVGTSAASDSRKAAQQTNGALDARIQQAVQTALTAQRTGDINSGTTITTTTPPLSSGGETDGGPRI